MQISHLQGTEFIKKKKEKPTKAYCEFLQSALINSFMFRKTLLDQKNERQGTLADCRKKNFYLVFNSVIKSYWYSFLQYG